MKITRLDMDGGSLQSSYQIIRRSLPKSVSSRGILGERGNAPLLWVWKEVNSLGAIFFPTDNHTASV